MDGVWLVKPGLHSNRFEWQVGYGAFSYSRSHIDQVYRYRQNQEAHHRKETFREEYIGLLEKFGVQYDPQYLFEELVPYHTQE